MAWIWIVLLVPICLLVGGYVYLAEYRGSGDGDDGQMSSGISENPAQTDSLR